MDILCISYGIVMKLKVTEWGNSHGVRITAAMMQHLQVKTGDEVAVNMTDNGIEIVKNHQPKDYLDAIKSSLLGSIYQQTEPVDRVENPYAETDAA